MSEIRVYETLSPSDTSITKYVAHKQWNVSSSEFNNACANSSYKQGYVLMPIDVQIFTTKEVSFPNDNSNWLMRKNIE